MATNKYESDLIRRREKGPRINNGSHLAETATHRSISALMYSASEGYNPAEDNIFRFGLVISL